MCVSARTPLWPPYSARVRSGVAPSPSASPVWWPPAAAPARCTRLRRGGPGRRTSRRRSPSAAPAGQAASAPARPRSRLRGAERARRAARGAPTDAEVRRELEQAFGSRAGRAIDAAGLGLGRPGDGPAGRAVARGGHHQRRQLGRAQALRLRRRPRAPGRRDVRRHRLRLLGLGVLRAGGGRAWSTARWTPRRWRASARPGPGAG